MTLIIAVKCWIPLLKKARTLNCQQGFFFLRQLGTKTIPNPDPQQGSWSLCFETLLVLRYACYKWTTVTPIEQFLTFKYKLQKTKVNEIPYGNSILFHQLIVSSSYSTTSMRILVITGFKYSCNNRNKSYRKKYQWSYEVVLFIFI